MGSLFFISCLDRSKLCLGTLPIKFFRVSGMVIQNTEISCALRRHICRVDAPQLLPYFGRVYTSPHKLLILFNYSLWSRLMHHAVSIYRLLIFEEVLHFSIIWSTGKFQFSFSSRITHWYLTSLVYCYSFPNTLLSVPCGYNNVFSGLTFLPSFIRHL